MKRKREYKPVGVKATVKLSFWFPGVTTCQEAQQMMRRILKVHSQEGDWFAQLGDTEQTYVVIEEDKATRLGLPRQMEPTS